MRHTCQPLIKSETFNGQTAGARHGEQLPEYKPARCARHFAKEFQCSRASCCIMLVSMSVKLRLLRRIKFTCKVKPSPRMTCCYSCPTLPYMLDTVKEGDKGTGPNEMSQLDEVTLQEVSEGNFVKVTWLTTTKQEAWDNSDASAAFKVPLICFCHNISGETRAVGSNDDLKAQWSYFPDRQVMVLNCCLKVGPYTTCWCWRAQTLNTNFVCFYQVCFGPP